MSNVKAQSPNITLVQNRIITAEPQRSQRKNLLFGGEIPPNKKNSAIEENAHDKCRSHQAPDLNPEGMQSLIQSKSPDWIREKVSLCVLCVFAVNLVFK